MMTTEKQKVIVAEGTYSERLSWVRYEDVIEYTFFYRTGKLELKRTWTYDLTEEYKFSDALLFDLEFYRRAVKGSMDDARRAKAIFDDLCSVESEKARAQNGLAIQASYWCAKAKSHAVDASRRVTKTESLLEDILIHSSAVSRLKTASEKAAQKAEAAAKRAEKSAGKMFIAAALAVAASFCAILSHWTHFQP